MSFLFRYLRFHDIIGGIHVPVDDGVDKLNRKYTLLVFLFLALPIFTKQYIGDPIECFAPVYFAEHQSRYINSYCWTQSTYYMVPVGDPDDDGDQQEPPDRITPDELDYFISFETVTHIGNERLRRVRVSYYQWAPLILLAQGLCFYIPFLIWNSCANNAGVKLRRLLKKASDIASLPPGCQQREALLAEFVDQFHTLVMGEAGWCADLQCGGVGAGVGSQLGVPGGTVSNSSAGSSASNSSAGSQGGHAHQHHHHHHHHQANGATGPGAGRGGARGGAGAQATSSTGPSGSEAAEHHRSLHQHHQSHGSGGGAGCCLVGIPILGSLISCCLRPCASFGLVGPSRYLCLLYLAVKFAYVFNVGLQFFLLGKFLGRGYLRHGLELINRVLLNGEWWASPRFPLSTLCQVRADMSGGLRSYTCQCVLPINVFNEKIFSVVWFYMAFLLPLNVLSLLFWVYRTFESNRMSYIRLCLWRTRLVELNQIHRTVRRLSQSYLGWDGVFLLRLIEHNHGSIMATLIMSRLWEFYANQIKLQEDANQIALANNAHNTLSNLTTTQAIAAGHQQHPHPPPPPAPQQQAQQQQQYLTNQAHGHGPAGGHAHHGHAQSGHGHHHNSAAHHHQQQMAGAGPGGAHHAHGHAPHGPHSLHGPHGFPGPHAPLQPTQMGGQFASGAATQGGGPHPPPPPPMVPHGPAGKQAHHSGQVSQAPGHHPLHAANTAATAHHVHHASMAAAAAAGPHLSGAFTGAHANLLAQLHHQANSNQQQQQQHQQQQQQQANNQQQPPGNVAAAVAALAAAAAATNNQPPLAANATQASGPAASSVAQSQEANSTSGPANAASNSTSVVATAAATNSSNTIHLNGLKQQQQQQHPLQAKVSAVSSTSGQTSGVGGAGGSLANGAAASASSSSATTSFITAGSGPPLPPPPPAHVVAAVAAASGAVPLAATSATSRLVSSGTSNPANPKAAGPATQNLSSSVANGGAQSAGGAPAPPPHTNPSLFNLKPSSLQQATGQTGSPGGASPGGPAGSARFAAGPGLSSAAAAAVKRT